MGFRLGPASLFFILLLIVPFVNDSAEARVRRSGGRGCATCGVGGSGSVSPGSCVECGGGNFQSMPGAGGCRTCGGPSSFSAMGIPINQGNSRITSANGVAAPQSAPAPRGSNGQTPDHGGSATTGNSGESGASARSTAPERGPVSPSDRPVDASEAKSKSEDRNLSEEEKIVENFVDAAPTTDEIIFQIGQLEAAEISRKFDVSNELANISDPEAKKKRAQELILSLKEAVTKKWMTIIEGLMKRAETDGDRRLKNIAKVLQARLDEVQPIFEKYAKDPINDGELKCVFCDHHHEMGAALAKVGFTKKGEKEPKFMGDFVSVDGKNYRLFIDRKTGTPYYSERGKNEAQADTFAHDSAVNQAIQKFYGGANLANDADKTLVASLTKHLSGPAPTVPAPPVVAPTPAKPATPVASRSVAGSNAKSVTGPTRQQTTPVSAGIGSTDAAKGAPPTLQVGYCEFCVRNSPIYRGRFETLKRQLREAWPNAKVSFYNAGIPAHVSITANGKAITGDTPLLDDSSSLVSRVRNSLAR